MAEAGSRSRFAKEKANLSQHFAEGNIRWYETTIEATVELDRRTLCEKLYTLRLHIPDDFPNSCPMLAVVRPAVLEHRNGLAIPSNSQEFQTLGRTREGFQGILHCLPSDWHASHGFVYQIFKKGMLWVRAYEEYLVTGVNVDDYIRLYHQAAKESPNQREKNQSVPIWSKVQVKRLTNEKERLDLFYPHHGQVKWSDDRRAVDVTVKTLQKKQEFTLRVYLPHDYPNSCPDLAVISPEKLLQVNGEPLPENSEEFATIDKKDGRYMKICHCGPTQWMDSYNIISVCRKGQTWVNAYELYLLKKDISFAECRLKFTQCSEHQ